MKSFKSSELVCNEVHRFSQNYCFSVNFTAVMTSTFQLLTFVKTFVRKNLTQEVMNMSIMKFFIPKPLRNLQLPFMTIPAYRPHQSLEKLCKPKRGREKIQLKKGRKMEKSAKNCCTQFRAFFHFHYPCPPPPTPCFSQPPPILPTTSLFIHRKRKKRKKKKKTKNSFLFPFFSSLLERGSSKKKGKKGLARASRKKGRRNASAGLQIERTFGAIKKSSQCVFPRRFFFEKNKKRFRRRRRKDEERDEERHKKNSSDKSLGRGGMGGLVGGEKSRVTQA